MIPAALEARLGEQGWLVLELPDPAPVFEARERLLAFLRQRGLRELDSLDAYHRSVTDDARHFELLHELAQHYWRRQLGRSIVARNLALFRDLVGPDLHIQNRPYLRAVRPGMPRDAAPLHRDTYYGASPFEVSIVVPFTTMDESAALRVVSGSHLQPDAAYPFTQHTSEDVTLGSPKHRLGYPYAPRLLDPAVDRRAVPVPLEVGEVAIFGLSLVHGGGVNDGSRTRFSTDIRIVNSHAPVAFSRGVDPEYFVPLCASTISRSARIHLDANRSSGTGDPEPG